ncbi:tRNA (adenosine(37)-N6)-dimethylallyltransferase MiaA [Aeromicrobium wangtongii]|uniref:tRNA dimethylallyltransferase n=1 Tax=Aeromicrobium wangtongii TaxID=2969247 RepID=A0ABY5M627_9ACTN|nr:tRNA (adenosine(37)-N6)-dimethylallyltransferase MiaA [Aeromicrobium wangtongii]MCD9198369.1 tRNA (adenosine(37)-N6)-dimethylallyltransferase MiaA [Aeromicrobium wangtongii]UUP12400.1 tRNA (adenosine(37)-N6)-dimethylallyltransferase MiaA [Aeromicrobium wangtongii]
MPGSERVVAVVGPTASGKSSLAVRIAQRLGSAEVVNADSMQLYRGMDIGTAKPTAAERAIVPHHLFDVLDVTETASVAEFQQLARDAIADCHARDVTPVLVGGSALYVRAVLDRLEFPGTDPAVRARWAGELERRGKSAMHAELARRDPAAAAQIHPSNDRRIVRALEVIELTGEPFTATMPGYDSIYPHLTILGLDVPRDVLDVRLAERVEQMWADGFVDEVRALLPQGLEDGLTASRALGYQQILAHLHGQMTEDEAREATITGTRKFARRQDRLFRKDPRIHWLPYAADDLVDQALDAMGRARLGG